MSGRLLTRKERADATKEYLSHSHPPVELDRGLYLLCRCKEFDCKPHGAHFHELSNLVCRYCLHPLRVADPQGYCPTCLHDPCYVEFCICGRGQRSLDPFPLKKSVAGEIGSRSEAKAK